ncbi:bifunctional tRNA (5-methylaminomethyl-2-thiouridine)(34)-methyltransferase MnmD/FAD-dependent 5-carboxymethylaminomethyl-2-thiouridine(34) oxidoreductase MnmC [uncultured Paraglaciecola sp.]|uniref:bifunctional tRNA (5-methylaminomethyl-2-thiouridine)(34)-methyltransferase MnmD/FAD-dependent 5-carboxymethylaminomethyl-2-thiouridine(34) oxidoreductase MnmC n=1 Tax=uncultured Paraglaciecola sp. TaxID=1765024 RepID=UPI002594C9D3|nr:bifunctional tRNA (5-methylaminomethyl-2-thiouridine)(34)-methyltransferase MnmD/FAD-dependent 5-carboxymethylaminomethyl-2-thiouridine(34) oxidoreductase MnmC [uncultured Paraglaciecola sp.]
MTITHADIHFNENGTPYATQFDDLYFSDAKGLGETEHVFLKNNQILSRWESCQTPNFVIAETGFGTGLNFLVTLLHFDLFLQSVPDCPLRLHFLSIEKFPINVADLTQALSLYPQLKQYSEELLRQYPLLVSGCHRLSFLEGTVTLDLWFGDVQQVLPQIEVPKTGLVDAWYLDGFAPSKNPDMWNDFLFQHMALLAKDQCSFSTFTAAGFVRRGLIAAGFDAKKCPGHGRKRDMLAGIFTSAQAKTVRVPYFKRTPATHITAPSIAIIGGGLAAANCAYALSKRGIKANIFCKDNELAKGASGNSQGGFYPQLNATAGHPSQIHATAFTYASRLYKTVLQSGGNFTHQWCGTLQLAFNDKVKQRYQKLADNKTWPESLVRWVDSQDAINLANVPLPYSGLFIEQGGWIHLPELITTLVKQSKAEVKTHHQLVSVARHGSKWQLNWLDGSLSHTDIIIYATGSDSSQLAPLNALPFRLVRGQVEYLESKNELANLNTVLCHKGYMTPSLNNINTIGSTYVKDDTNCDYRFSEQQQNIEKQQKALQDCQWAKALSETQGGRAGIRCSSPDHLPMVGAVPDITEQTKQYTNLYKALPVARYPEPADIPNSFMLCGLGSRGLTTAPLCAELLVSQMLGEPLPLANHLLDALNPNRFLIRSLIRRQN